jgi:hypothetical protein
MSVRPFVAVPILALAACSPSGNGSNIYTGATDSGIPSTSASTAEGSGDDSEGGDGTDTNTDADADADSETETGNDDDTTKYDIAPEDTGDTAIDEGCGKIDFLFVIDNSASMQEEQENLIQSFPGFIGEIVDVTEAQDFHIMVTTAEWSEFVIGRCADKCQTDNDPTCFWDDSIECADSAFINPDRWPCADSLGVGVDTDLNGASCGLAGGHRYITDAQANLADAFECIARVGTDGAVYEFALDAQIFATSDEYNAVDGCHPGFLRDDAVLVVTFVTDEAGNDWGGAAAAYDALVAAKNADPSAIVMLGLFGDTHLPNPVCTSSDQNMGGAHPGPHYQSYVESFGDRGHWCSVCEPEYSTCFHDAVSVIDTACEEFEPPG